MGTSACIASRIQCSNGTVFRAIYKQGTFIRSDGFLESKPGVRFSTPEYLRNLIEFRHNDSYSLRSMHLGVLPQDPSVRFKSTL